MISRLIRNVLKNRVFAIFLQSYKKFRKLIPFLTKKKLFQLINFILQVIQETAGLHAIHLCVMELK